MNDERRDGQRKGMIRFRQMIGGMDTSKKAQERRLQWSCWKNVGAAGGKMTNGKGL